MNTNRVINGIHGSRAIKETKTMQYRGAGTIWSQVLDLYRVAVVCHTGSSVVLALVLYWH